LARTSTSERQLLGAIAVAVQRGNALAMLTGYSRACGAQTYERRWGAPQAPSEEGEGIRDEEET
jgi:hypothetical protein